MMIARNQKSVRRIRRGAVLLDLFIATLIFVTCAIALGEFGSRSLQLARTNSIERIAALKAESILVQEANRSESSDNRRWQETFQAIPFEIQVSKSTTEWEELKRVVVTVTAMNGSRRNRPSVSFNRLMMSTPAIPSVREEK